LPLPKGFPRLTLTVDPELLGDRRVLLAAAIVLLAALGVWLLRGGLGPSPRPVAGPLPVPAASADGYLFCTWNVENFFDDQDDPTNHDADEDWFGRDPTAVRAKVDLLAHALLTQNGGRGPDLLAVVEVESRRAALLLRDALNARLDPADHYTGVVHRPNRTGRRFGPAVLTRLPVRDDLTRSYVPLRMLEVHVVGPGDAPLIVLASHWTSRLRDGGDARRATYADAVYRAVAEAVASDPEADVLVAGDFNDEPGDASLIDHLHAVADPDLVRSAARRGDPPLLLDLTAGLDPDRDGTYRHDGRWEVLDHVAVSAGLLDPAGWQVRPETLRAANAPALRTGRDGRPWRFGGPTNQAPRGPSDHFALTVRLKVAPDPGADPPVPTTPD